jgi:hypothetical protein
MASVRYSEDLRDKSFRNPNFCLNESSQKTNDNNNNSNGSVRLEIHAIGK